jgi:hypothetical protein
MPTVDVKINNKTYNGVSVINFPLADGSGYAPFNLDSSHIVTKCSVTYNLTDVTSSNTVTSIPGGSAYTTTLSTSLAGRVVSGVIVTMGGETLSGVYDSSTKVITIPEVTVNIVITATTAEDLTAPVYKLTTPTTFDTTTTPINTGIKLLDTEDSDWTVCAEIEVLTDGATGNTTGEVSANNYNSFKTRIAYNSPLSTLFMDKSGTIGTSIWVGEKAGNTARYVVTHVAGSLDVNVRAKVTTVKGSTADSEITVTGTAYQPSDNNVFLKVGDCTYGSYSVKNCYVYRRVLDSSEITAYMS